MDGLQPTFLTPLTVLVTSWCVFISALFLSRFTANAAILPDHPTTRSSHKMVTSRSGGIAIFCGWFLGVVLLEAMIRIDGGTTQFFPLIGLAILAFGLGLSDDHWSLPATVKLAGQVFIAFMFVSVFGGIEAAPLPFLGVIELGPFGIVLSVFWIVAFMNAFNFMDGINGIAALAGIIASVTLALLSASMGETAWAIASLMLGLALAGFLPLNFRAARLFMGDSGSQSVSFLLAGLGLLAARSSNGGVSHILIPLIMTPFLFDVAFTLLHRRQRGRNIFDAHCEHIYQLLVRMGWSHEAVATLYLAATLICAGLGVVTMSFGATAQWAAVAIIMIVSFIPARRVFLAAKEMGLLEPSESQEQALEPNAPDGAQEGSLFQQAAE